MIDLSIVPLYTCNMNCSFCYLGIKRQDKTILKICDVEKIVSNVEIRNIDIYGGEISLLDDEYVEALMHVVGDRQISLVTNTIGFEESYWKNYYMNDNIDLSFSYDLRRSNVDTIKKNILKFDATSKKYSIICIDIDDLDYEFLEKCINLKSISIKPYSKSVYNKQHFDQHMTSIYQKLYYEHYSLFSKLEKITGYRDQIPHYFLLPDGKLYDIRYDNGHEYFCEIDKCKENVCKRCLCCKFFKKCFNEHYYGYEFEDECIGRKNTMEFLNGLYYIH